ncbi:MAG: hypothetical protein ABIS03_09610 [Gemmatimonadaceae bacterium]
MRPFERLVFFWSVFVVLAFSSTASAQVTAEPLRPDTASAGPLEPFVGPVVTVSEDSVDRLRLAYLTGKRPLRGILLRSTSSLMDARAFGKTPRPYTIVLPQATSVTNSDLPFGQNDGALWGSKGYNQRVLAGFTANLGPVSLKVIPEFVHSTNYRYSIDPTDLRFARPIPSSRSDYSSPFNYIPYSIDYPWRFGDSAITRIYPGQSSLTVSLGLIQVGGATENEWWGPALRNPIVLGDNAAGFPHAFLRTSEPLATAIGQFEGRWVVGGLKESDYFDKDPTNDVRSLSAIAITWKRRESSGLTLGFERSVFAPVDGYSGVAARSFDFIRGTGRPNALPVGDSTFVAGPDQLTSVFAHYAVPVYGLEAYVEWARSELPASLRDFKLQPMHTRGYTTGLQWAHEISGGPSMVRLQTEFTNVEQSTTFRFRPQGSFYTSRAAVQGYTNEGQMLANGVGPGSSGQWFAADYLNGSFIVGANFIRTRNNNDAFFARANPHRCFHDVTVAPGARAGISTRFFRVRADYSRLTRYNAFFQRVNGCQTDDSAIGDRSSHYLSLTLSLLGW